MDSKLPILGDPAQLTQHHFDPTVVTSQPTNHLATPTAILALCIVWSWSAACPWNIIRNFTSSYLFQSSCIATDCRPTSPSYRSNGSPLTTAVKPGTHWRQSWIQHGRLCWKSTVAEIGNKSATKSTVAVYVQLCCRYVRVSRQCVPRLRPTYNKSWIQLTECNTWSRAGVYLLTRHSDRWCSGCKKHTITITIMIAKYLTCNQKKTDG